MQFMNSIPLTVAVREQNIPKLHFIKTQKVASQTSISVRHSHSKTKDGETRLSFYQNSGEQAH